MRNALFTGAFILGGLINCMAQGYQEGDVIIVQDSRIDTLLKYHRVINKALQDNLNDDGIAGYRIQVFFDSGNNSKSRATAVMEAFIEKYPEVGCYISFKEPYYRIRVGDFRSKIEALGFLDKILRSYPNAWVIKDKIKFPALGKENMVIN